MRRLLRNNRGATAIEYAFLAAMIATAIATSVGTLGTKVTNSYSVTASKF